MLDCYKGMPQFEWIEEIRTGFEDIFKIKSKSVKAVSFEINPYLKGLENFTSLFNSNIYKKVLEVDYKPINKKSKKNILHVQSYCTV